MSPGTTPITPEPEGLAAARAVSQWYLGDPGWADNLVKAYLHPAVALEALRQDKAASQ